ncbi:hypothetical protein [Mucilaginibacter terrae]|uniref:Uncharacterized protein n=1 Tax=Mucilaginibacter terrae TaxID=1955052 RepID=A0ABU3GV91_9SPHI|nr:hypothetical protein [Mucilaginibacter terrae]MDT3403696.1 hypothetical protein [Mucilaginibacter terrae]
MKTTLIIALAMLACGISFAQTVVNRSYPVKAGQPILLKFDYPVVKISTWDKNEVAVTAKVSINDGENDDALVLESETIDGVLQISNKIKDMKNLPHRYTVWEGEKKTIFKTEDDFKAYKSKAGNIRSYSNGVDLDIKLEIKVPANSPTEVKAIYGLVYLANFYGPVKVDATYGGIDATLDKARAGQITATTSYGRIYSNLDLTLTDKTNRDFFTSITAQPGKGPSYTLKSTYGKIYMRKP